MAQSRSLLASILGMRCPRCRQSRLFLNPNPYALRDMQKMHTACPVCKQDFIIEPGFYFGASYVSYALNIAWIIPTFLLLYGVFHVDYTQYMIFMLVTLPLLVPFIFRLSRTIWLHSYVKHDPQAAAQAPEQP
ncbi:MAG: DUF983 domain-containing protein [Bacteroidia bacterium]|nr:DUF983 domain-containing protein [Bacteroidia bacterium]